MKASPVSISSFALALLITGSIDSLRNLPATALFGSLLPFFFCLAAILFLIPVSFVSAELSANLPGEGGIFAWVDRALGQYSGMVAIWLLWINTMIFFPTILSFIASTAVYFLDPQLANNRYFLISVILSVIWILTLINLRGLKLSAKFASVCAIIGMVIPMTFIMLLALAWLLLGHSSQLHFSTETLIPSLHQSNSWVSLTAIITSFLGMELATVHVAHIKNAKQKFPRALMLSMIFIIITMLFGSLAIAVVLPAKQINLVAGLMQAFGNFLAAYHMSFLMPILTLMIVIGSIGGMINWLISPARGLQQAGNRGFLPKTFCKANKADMPSNILLLQAILVSMFCLVFLLMPSINASYWLLTDLSTELYLLMYILMFVSAFRLRKFYRKDTEAFKVRGKYSLFVLCGLGLAGCTVATVIGFIPPDGITLSMTIPYPEIFAMGLLIMILPLLGLWFYKAKQDAENQVKDSSSEK
ncbi:MAG: transporter [Gammaproteobacteria bacterium RIFCSPHIGHO2_12_FULL_41_15]|nr:MAG: transporter [Gammaproteobacteria bacterium RIFCSPHIGHO2_12_FULL_41_15]